MVTQVCFNNLFILKIRVIVFTRMCTGTRMYFVALNLFIFTGSRDSIHAHVYWNAKHDYFKCSRDANNAHLFTVLKTFRYKPNTRIIA